MKYKLLLEKTVIYRQVSKAILLGSAYITFFKSLLIVLCGKDAFFCKLLPPWS